MVKVGKYDPPQKKWQNSQIEIQTQNRPIRVNLLQTNQRFRERVCNLPPTSSDAHLVVNEFRLLCRFGPFLQPAYLSDTVKSSQYHIRFRFLESFIN